MDGDGRAIAVRWMAAGQDNRTGQYNFDANKNDKRIHKTQTESALTQNLNSFWLGACFLACCLVGSRDDFVGCVSFKSGVKSGFLVLG